MSGYPDLLEGAMNSLSESLTTTRASRKTIEKSSASTWYFPHLIAPRAIKVILDTTTWLFDMTYANQEWERTHPRAALTVAWLVGIVVAAVLLSPWLG